ncbi:MAG TPA: arsenite methyltransferase [Methanomicrobia archaeon]|nr:arsenite methyltransferase [Methanomicrobia archaeon]
MNREKEIKEYVKDRYARIASTGDSCCPGCACSADRVQPAEAIGYSERELSSVPEGAVLGLGCGNPTALAELQVGETVLDLGPGGGLDVFLAAQKVGAQGKVIGVDMTPEMIEKARENARKGHYLTVEFRLGELENLPIEDNSIDVIISNCVINLSPDKRAAFKEAFRVLRPNGRILISDVVTEGELPEDVRRSFEAWAGCIAGALEKQEYLDTIRKAGFRNVMIVGEHFYSVPNRDDRLTGNLSSIHVRAYKC